jgi:hypothetical protein
MSPVIRFYGMSKNLRGTREIPGKIHGHFLPSPCFTTRCLCCNQSRELWLDKSGMIKTQMGSTIDLKMVTIAWDALYNTTL